MIHFSFPIDRLLYIIPWYDEEAVYLIQSFNSQEKNLLGLLSNTTVVLKHNYFLFVPSGFGCLILFF